MSNDNEAIAAWAARKKQRKLEQQQRTKALQEQVNAANHPPLDWGTPDEGSQERLQQAFAKHGMKVITPEETKDLLSLIPEGKESVEVFNEQYQTMPVVKGLSFDAAKGMYRCRAYKDSRQINLYWGPSLKKALEAIADYRATEQ